MKGFTLLELLAVIVILSVILLISVPMINDVIENVKINSFKVSSKSLAKAAEYTYANEVINGAREVVFEFDDYEMSANFPDAKLEFNGKSPKSGNLIIRKDGKMAYSFYDGKYCSKKDYLEQEPVISEISSEDCISEVSLPTVTVVGQNPRSIEINELYTDEGATALGVFGDPITNISVEYKKDGVTVPSIDTSVTGTYRVIYTVVEESKTNYAERTVIVSDTIKPVITIPVSTSIVISDVNSFNFLTGVSVTDNSLETLSIQVSGSIARIAGSYEIIYSATDSSGNTETVSRIINVNDIESPLLTLIGDAVINLNVGDTYTELNATSVDDADGDLSSIIVKTGSVNTSVPGTYFITYTSKDSSNNESSITRTVNVIDNVSPTVTFGTNGNATYVASGSTTVTVTDNVSVMSRYYQWTTSTVAPTSVSFTQSFSSGASLATPASVTGTYYLWIKAIDENANETIIRTNAFNVDNSVPLITNVTNSSNGAWTNADVTLGWNATDSGSGLSVMQFSYDKVTINPTSIPQPSSNPTSWNTSAIWTSERDVLVYFRVIDAAGNASAWSVGTAVRIDKTAPTFTTLTSGFNHFQDTGLASGLNSMTVYNNLGNGLVVHNRIPMTTPTGSGYGLRITSNGAVEPGLGGFYQAVNSKANGVYIHRIIARIPVGYSINIAANAIGTGASFAWLTSNLGTGDWFEYMYIGRAGATGTFSSLGFAFIAGPTPTPANPLIWDVAYAGLVDSTYFGQTIDATFSGYDTASGITGYSYGTVGSPGAYTSVTNTANIAKMNTGYTANQNVYVWLRDQAGNQTSGLIAINQVDRTAPTVVIGTNGNGAYAKTSSTTLTATDAGCGVSTLHYQWTTSTTPPSAASFSTPFVSGGTVSTPASVTGIYYLWVKAVDNCSNQMIDRSYPFYLDNTAPTLTLNGSSSVSITQGSAYSDAGATATDSVNGNITGSISVTSNLNVNIAGTYTVYYNVSDSSGNAATQITRTVTVNPLITVYNFGYTGNIQVFSAPYTGTYKFQVWGAQGGGAYGGNGGYAEGNIYLIATRTMYVSVGGMGDATSQWSVGGFNGGGQGGYGAYPPGGGATDIRIDDTPLNNRAIVAGGGGGASQSYYGSGHGGGLEGVSTSRATGGTQTAGGVSSDSSAYSWTFGYAGVGGAAYYGSDSGGGGGYFGGASGSVAGAGGSSFVGSLSSAMTRAGNASMPNPAGGSMVGRQGHGYARITFLY